MSSVAPAGRAVDPYEELYGGEAAQRFFEAGELVGQVGEYLDFGSLIYLNQACSRLRATLGPTIEYLKGRTVGVSADCPRIQRLELSKEMKAHHLNRLERFSVDNVACFLQSASAPMVQDFLGKRAESVGYVRPKAFYAIMMHLNGHFPDSLRYRFARAFPGLGYLKLHRDMHYYYGACWALDRYEEKKRSVFTHHLPCILARHGDDRDDLDCLLEISEELNERWPDPLSGWEGNSEYFQKTCFLGMVCARFFKAGRTEKFYALINEVLSNFDHCSEEQEQRAHVLSAFVSELVELDCPDLFERLMGSSAVQSASEQWTEILREKWFDLPRTLREAAEEICRASCDEKKLEDWQKKVEWAKLVDQIIDAYAYKDMEEIERKLQQISSTKVLKHAYIQLACHAEDENQAVEYVKRAIFLGGRGLFAGQIEHLLGGAVPFGAYVDRVFHPEVKVDRQTAYAILAKMPPEKGLELLAQLNFSSVFKVTEREIIQATFRRECGLPLVSIGSAL